jgi:hypothetical protein
MHTTGVLDFTGLPMCIYHVRNTDDNLPVDKHLSILNGHFLPAIMVEEKARIFFDSALLSQL